VTNPLEDLLAAHDAADRIYDALVKTRTISKRALLTYRFGRCRCAVLHVIESPNGVILGFPRYKMSRSLNSETSNASGRANNTEDGDRHWKQHAGYFVSDVNIELRCDHARKTINTNEIDSDLKKCSKDRVVLLSE